MEGWLKYKKSKTSISDFFCKNHLRKKFNKSGENQPEQSHTRSKQMDTNRKKEGAVKMKEPLKCWGCGEPHLLRDFSKHS